MFFHDFPNECWLRIGYIDRAERMFCLWSNADFFWRSTVLHWRKTQWLQRNMLHVQVALCFLGKIQHLHFQATVIHDIMMCLYWRPRLSGSKVGCWKTLEFVLLLLLMFSECRCFVLLCYNSKWTTNGPEYCWPMSKTENTRVQSVSSVWVLCLISDFIFIKWYNITIIPFFTRTLWVNIYVIRNPPLSGVFSPHLFMSCSVIFDWDQIKCN